MDNTNKQAVVSAIWADPARAFGCDFRQSGKYFENLRGGEYEERGKIRITLYADGSNIRVYYNGSSRDETSDVFTYLQTYVLKTANFADTLRSLGDRYGLALKFTPEERETMRRGDLARHVAASLIEALRVNPNGPTARYIRDVRRLEPDGHFGELTPDSLARARESLRLHGKRWDAADFEALGLTEARARAGYNCVIPYRLNGEVQGFIYRNIKPTPSGPKYLYSEGLGRPGYCDRLEQGKPAVIVEGQLDAVRLIQQGVRNVIAIGGAKIGGEIARLLRGRGISEVVYIPDSETDEHGQRKTKIITDAIRAFQHAEADGEPVIQDLWLVDLPTPSGANEKIDADSFGAENSGSFAGMIELEAVPAWHWEFERLRDWAARAEQGHRRPPVGAVQEKITDIYNRNRSPYTRQRIRDYVGRCDDLARYGVTPRALADIEEWNKGREYQNRVRQAAADLGKAVQDGANPETVGAIVRRLADAQGANTRAEWEAQLSEPFEAELAAIREQPETLATKWKLYRIKSKKKDESPRGQTKGQDEPIQTERVEFYPADIAVFCAATSHGKTAVLFEAALDLVRNNPGKLFLFVSCEENKRQLLERALNVFLPIDTTATGKTEAGAFCFIRGTRKRAIKAALRNAPAPDGYETVMDVSEHFEDLRKQIARGVEQYGRQVRPRLKFVHTEASAESICANILHYVEQYRARGVEVGGVFVDYMQLLTTEARNFSRTDELKEICKALKDCAARTELPVIIAAQLNREVLRNTNAANGTPLDNITVANIGEGADIERIAHDIYLVWQTDKTPLQWYTKAPTDANAAAPEPVLNPAKIAGGIRSRRLFSRGELGRPETAELKTGYLYIEQLKARDGVTGGWGLLPFDGERGTVGPNDTAKMGL